jgi:hypothetical protein
VSRATRLNVAVTANTAQFDRQMAKVRAKVKATQQGLSGGAGGALSAAGIGGGFGAGAGMLLRGSPLLAAIGGLTMALEAQKRTTEEGRKDVTEMALLGLSPTKQSEAKVASQLLGGEGAGDLIEVKRAFEGTDRKRDRELTRAGLSQEQIDRLNTSDISQFTEDLIELSRSLSASQRLSVADALGGKAGQMFMRAGMVEQERLPDISSAIKQTGLEAAARALSVALSEQQQLLDGSGLIDVGTQVADALSGQNEKTAQRLAELVAASSPTMAPQPAVNLTAPQPTMVPAPAVNLTTPPPAVNLAAPQPTMVPAPAVNLEAPEPQELNNNTADADSNSSLLSELWNWLGSIGNAMNIEGPQETGQSQKVIEELRIQTGLMRQPTGPGI